MALRIISGPGGPGGSSPRPYGRVTNRIITRGMGPHINRLITQGYGGPPPFVIDAIQRVIVTGQSGHKRRLEELDEVIIWAKMIQVNNKPAPPDIKGFVKVKVDKNRGIATVMAEHVSTRVRSIWEVIKVTVSRLK